MELVNRMQEKDRTDKLGGDDISVEDQRSVNEITLLMKIQKSHSLRAYYKLF